MPRDRGKRLAAAWRAAFGGRRTSAIFGAAVLVACAAVLVLAAIGWRVGERVTAALTPPRQGVQASSAPAGAVEVALRPRPGLVLRGWYVPSRNGAGVILVHGYGTSRVQLIAEARALAARGYGVLLFDMRGHGQSGGKRISWGVDEQSDVAAAVDWMSHRPDVGAMRIGALGFSYGAMTLSEVAAHDQRLRALVLEGAYTSLDAMTRHDERGWGAFSGAVAVRTLERAGIAVGRVRTVSAVSLLAPRPVLIVAGNADQSVPLAVTRELYAAARPPKYLLVVQGAGHGGYAAADDRYLREVVSFFDRALASQDIRRGPDQGALDVTPPGWPAAAPDSGTPRGGRAPAALASR